MINQEKEQKLRRKIGERLIRDGSPALRVIAKLDLAIEDHIDEICDECRQDGTSPRDFMGGLILFCLAQIERYHVGFTDGEAVSTSALIEFIEGSMKIGPGRVVSALIADHGVDLVNLD